MRVKARYVSESGDVDKVIVVCDDLLGLISERDEVIALSVAAK